VGDNIGRGRSQLSTNSKDFEEFAEPHVKIGQPEKVGARIGSLKPQVVLVVCVGKQPILEHHVPDEGRPKQRRAGR
jgi:hypothetical protein